MKAHKARTAGLTPGGEEAALELEYSAEDLYALSTDPQRKRGVPRIGVSLGVVAAVVLMCSVAYLTSKPTQPVKTAVNTPAPTLAAEVPPPFTPEPEPEPVRFANPFDETEVFEFPPGTSKAEARDAVAGLLIKRARERQDAGTIRSARRDT